MFLSPSCSFILGSRVKPVNLHYTEGRRKEGSSEGRSRVGKSVIRSWKQWVSNYYYFDFLNTYYPYYLGIELCWMDRTEFELVKESGGSEFLFSLGVKSTSLGHTESTWLFWHSACVRNRAVSRRCQRRRLRGASSSCSAASRRPEEPGCRSSECVFVFKLQRRMWLTCRSDGHRGGAARICMWRGKGSSSEGDTHSNTQSVCVCVCVCVCVSISPHHHRAYFIQLLNER